MYNKSIFLVVLTLLFLLTACNESSDGSKNTGNNSGENISGDAPPADIPPTDTPPAADTYSLSGQVDSHFIDRNDINAMYLFRGTVTPDDIDGDNGDPIAVAHVTQNPGACSWSYNFSNLDPGDYTLAFTNTASVDNTTTNDVLSFVKTTNFTIVNAHLQYNVTPDKILRVGPGRTYTTLSAASTAVVSGDVVEIDAGTYVDDISVWRQNNITLRGVGGRAHLKANAVIQFISGSDSANGKGIWVIKGSNVQVENIEFSNASVSVADGENGAGIRAESSGDLTICNGYFHDNQNGILGEAAGTLLIEYSEFDHNGLGDYGKTHNMYIGSGAKKFVLRYSYSHHAYIGHNVKTRAKENYILFNRIMDETTGQSSYDIDIPNGGLTYIIGNLMHQGVNTDNSTMLSYGAEGLSAGRTHHLYIINNTLNNDLGRGTFIYINPGSATNPASATIMNNLFIGSGTAVSDSGGVAVKNNNLSTTNAGLVDIDTYDFHLLSSSPARDAGADPGMGDGMDLNPALQYVHPRSYEERAVDSAIDIGAYEYAP